MYDEDVAQADTNEEKKEEQVCCFHKRYIVQEKRACQCVSVNIVRKVKKILKGQNRGISGLTRKTHVLFFLKFFLPAQLHSGKKS